MDAWLPRPAEAAEEGIDEDDLPEGVTPEMAAQFMRRSQQRGPPLVPIFKLMTPTPLPVTMMGGS